MPSIKDFEDLIADMKKQLADLKKRNLDAIEAEEKMKAEFEKRKPHELPRIISDEEKRVAEQAEKFKKEIDDKEKEL